MVAENVLYPSLDTPVVLVDMDKLETNIAEMSRFAAEAGVRLRPHVKVHQCADIARMQIAAGACGIDVGSMGQAEAMTEAGLDDILISHPGYYGGHKFERLMKLLSQTGLKITLMVDMVEQAEGISRAGQAVGRTVPVLIKVDTNASLSGYSRLGVLPGQPLLDFARKIRGLANIELTGIYAHEIGAKPTPEGVAKMAYETASLVVEMAGMLRKEGIPVEHVSVGASPTFRDTCRYLKEGKISGITEIDPGNCVIGDLGYMKTLANTREACAATVLTTVISTSHPEKAAIDAGYKTFGADFGVSHAKEPDFYWNGLPSFGSVQNRPDIWPGRLSAETGYIYYKDPGKKLGFGERVEIVPNNATLVINIHNELYGVRNGAVERVFTVTARGRGS